MVENSSLASAGGVNIIKLPKVKILNASVALDFSLRLCLLD